MGEQLPPHLSSHPAFRAVAEEEERKLAARFPYLAMSPEEWVARNAHHVWAFGYNRIEFEDARLTQWMVAVAALISDRAAVQRLWKQYLTSDEIADAERIEQQEV